LKTPQVNSTEKQKVEQHGVKSGAPEGPISGTRLVIFVKSSVTSHL